MGPLSTDAPASPYSRAAVWVAVVAVVALVAASVFAWRRHHHLRGLFSRAHAANAASHRPHRPARGDRELKHARRPTEQPPAIATGAPTSTGSAAPSAPMLPGITGKDEVAVELWVRDPEAIAATIIPRVMRVPSKALQPGLAQIIKNGLPKEVQADIDEIDFKFPLGVMVLNPDLAPGGAGTRVVYALSLKDTASGAKAVEHYAMTEGATKERSAALNAEVFRGTRSGRYLAAADRTLFFATDKRALDFAGPLLLRHVEDALIQKRDVVGRAPKSWITGSFVRFVKQQWLDWSTPQLGKATTGPAKELFDDIESKVEKTWVGAQDLDLAIDFGEQVVHVEANLAATPASPLSKFLAEYPMLPPTTLLDAPRDAVSAMAFRFPSAALDTIRRFLVTPPAGVDVPEDVRTRTEAVFSQLTSALEGDLLFANIPDPPPDSGPGGSLFRLKVRSEEQAKKAARDLSKFLLPPEVTTTPITVEGGGSGEAQEFVPKLEGEIPAGQPMPKIPMMGMAWIVRGGHLYVARGSSPKLRVTRFASPKADDHLGHDPDVKGKLAKLPASVAAAAVLAPLRADTHLAAAMGAEPSSQAITIGVQPSATGIAARADLDVDLAIQVLGPMLMQSANPQQGAPPGGAGGAAPGGPSPLGPGMGQPPMPGPGRRPPRGRGPGGRPGMSVPPAPSGYVLPVPKPGAGRVE